MNSINHAPIFDNSEIIDRRKQEYVIENIENIEKKYKGKIITLDTLNLQFPNLAYFLKKIGRYHESRKSMLILELLESPPSALYEQKVYSVHFFTKENHYAISATPVSLIDKGYLGCIALRNSPNPGETWLRGNDLPDGPFCDSTWNDIMAGIIAYEMKNIA